MSAQAAGGVTVSIVTPCYNGGAFIEATLRSAIDQTRPPLEVILVDDGSTDDSAAIAERAGPLVRVIRQSNQGESVARNRGIAEARGTHLLFLDADDLLAPEALEHLASAIADLPNAVAIMGCAWFSRDPDTPDSVQELRHTAFYPDIIEANFGPPHCWLVPRLLVQKAGGFAEDMRWFEDWDLWWRVGLHADSLVHVPYVGAKYRQHAKSQLATTAPPDRARGHAVLVGRMVSTIVGAAEVLEPHGERLYWSAWSALTHARQRGVGWHELAPLTAALRVLARRGPAGVRSLGSARLIRLLGVGAAWRIQRLTM